MRGGSERTINTVFKEKKTVRYVKNNNGGMMSEPKLKPILSMYAEQSCIMSRIYRPPAGALTISQNSHSIYHIINQISRCIDKIFRQS